MPEPPNQDTFIGLMSGTSLDGIDAAAVQFEDHGIRLLSARTSPFPQELRSELLTLMQDSGNRVLDRLGRLDHVLGTLFADAALNACHAAGFEPHQISAIGSHGLTLLHRPDDPHPFTLQIGDPNRIAERTGITTVADFRRRDVAAGGQGAPLVPAFHADLFSRSDRSRVVVNIGGMANLTLLPKATGQPVSGYDTGPGNVLLDTWVQRQRSEAYDADGTWAAAGQVQQELLEAFLADPYFHTPPPKSTGREHFNADWLEQRIASFRLNAEDVQATLTELTAVSIARAIEQSAAEVDDVIVCGGGAYNPVLLGRLAAHLPHAGVSRSDEHGLAAEWVEAVAFAWLARQTLAGKPGNIPSVTGARHPVVLGGIYPAGE